MLTIRFSRIGKKKHPFYRIVISEKTKDTQGTYLELLGHYNPITKEATLKNERIKHWLNFGATTSSSVFNLLLKQGVVTGDKKQTIHESAKRKEKRANAKAKTTGDSKAAEDKAQVSKKTEASVVKDEKLPVMKQAEEHKDEVKPAEKTVGAQKKE